MGLEIFVIKRARMDRKTKTRVEDRRQAGLCIGCGEKEIHRRDLCTTCHGRYIANRPKGVLKSRKYEAEMISKGLLGENRQGQRSGKNVYREVSQKIESEAG